MVLFGMPGLKRFPPHTLRRPRKWPYPGKHDDHFDKIASPQATGGNPTPEQLAQLQALVASMSRNAAPAPPGLFSNHLSIPCH
jgi:hypothetical protein